MNRLADEEKIQSSREERLRGSDPWQAAGAVRTSEQGGWLLSYLDVMTLLFTFFVLLFAYQKAMTDVDAKPEPIAPLGFHASAASPRLAAKMPPEPPTAGEIVEPTPDSKATAIAADVGNTPGGAVSAIAEMKSQSALREVARDFTMERQAREDTQAQDKPTPLKPALEAMARIGRAVLPDAAASEQTAAQLAGLLAGEAAQKRVDIVRAPHEIRVELNDAILFDPASTVLRAEGLALLDRLAPVLAQQAGIVSIEGHTDPMPIANLQFPSNWELSSARATAVTRHLIQKGIPADRLRAVGMADTQPRDSNATPAGRARNRRVSLVVYLNGANPQPVLSP